MWEAFETTDYYGALVREITKLCAPAVDRQVEMEGDSWESRKSLS